MREMALYRRKSSNKAPFLLNVGVSVFGKGNLLHFVKNADYVKGWKGKDKVGGDVFRFEFRKGLNKVVLKEVFMDSQEFIYT